MAAKEISVKKYVVRLTGEERERLETLIRKGKSPVVPENPIHMDSRDEAESAHHAARCLHSFSCLGPLSPTCSSRGAGSKSRISFSAISSILR